MPERIIKENIENWEGFPKVVGEGSSISPEELLNLAKYIMEVFAVEEMEIEPNNENTLEED